MTFARTHESSARSRRGTRGLLAWLLAVAAQASMLGACAAAEGVRQLSFDWPKPTADAACELHDPSIDAARQRERFTGTVERSERLGVACTVQIARRRFDAVYRFCTVTNVDAVPREHYACWVMYSPAQVTFLYSYADDYYGPPACEFACSLR